MGRKEKAILITIFVNIALIALRFSLAGISGSIGLTANAWHSFSDVFVSSVVFLGLAIERAGANRLKKAASKIEPVLAILVSLFIFYMAVELVLDLFSNEDAELRSIPFAAAGAFLGVLTDYFLARYKIHVGEKEKSASLIADGYHSKMDMYCSLAVLIGLLGSLIGLPWLDIVAGLLALVLIIVSAYEILFTNIQFLRQPHKNITEIFHSHAHTNHSHEKR
jgi:membrane protease subunit HflK